MSFSLPMLTVLILQVPLLEFDWSGKLDGVPKVELFSVLELESTGKRLSAEGIFAPMTLSTS